MLIMAVIVFAILLLLLLHIVVCMHFRMLRPVVDGGREGAEMQMLGAQLAEDEIIDESLEMTRPEPVVSGEETGGAVSVEAISTAEEASGFV